MTGKRQLIRVGLPLQFTVKDHVIANEVKQSHKSKYRLLRRFTPRNDIDGHMKLEHMYMFVYTGLILNLTFDIFNNII